MCLSSPGVPGDEGGGPSLGGASMKFSLIPREFRFFDLFDRQADCALKASAYFKELVHLGRFDDETVQRMREIEHEGDDITHEIINKLNKTFITPFDREDIHLLAHELDSVIDLIHTICNQMRLYRLSVVNQHMMQFSDIIDNAVTVLVRAVKGLREYKEPDNILEDCIEVNRLENSGDQLRDFVISKLFDEATDPIHLIKWKEVFQGAEMVLDKCEDVANIVETILVKQA